MGNPYRPIHISVKKQAVFSPAVQGDRLVTFLFQKVFICLEREGGSSCIVFKFKIHLHSGRMLQAGYNLGAGLPTFWYFVGEEKHM